MTNAQRFKETFRCDPKNKSGSYMCPPKDYRDINCMDGFACETCLLWWNEEYKELEDDKRKTH